MFVPLLILGSALLCLFLLIMLAPLKMCRLCDGGGVGGGFINNHMDTLPTCNGCGGKGKVPFIDLSPNS